MIYLKDAIEYLPAKEKIEPETSQYYRKDTNCLIQSILFHGQSCFKEIK